MTDNEKEGDGTTSRGPDWEVVSLTASAYAAAPGPQEYDSSSGNVEKVENSGQTSSGAMFMSGHFVFPPSEHENLPIEIHGEAEAYDVSSYGQDDSGFDDAELINDLHRVEYYEGGSSALAHDLGFTEGKGYQSSNLEEQNTFTQLEHDSRDASEENVESPEKNGKQNAEKDNGSDLPCRAWWKRHATSFYQHAKEANTFWSIVVAAAVVGLVIIGHRWQRDKWQLRQPKWRFSIRR